MQEWVAARGHVAPVRSSQTGLDPSTVHTTYVSNPRNEDLYLISSPVTDIGRLTVEFVNFKPRLYFYTEIRCLSDIVTQRYAFLSYYQLDLFIQHGCD